MIIIHLSQYILICYSYIFISVEHIICIYICEIVCVCIYMYSGIFYQFCLKLHSPVVLWNRELVCDTQFPFSY